MYTGQGKRPGCIDVLPPAIPGPSSPNLWPDSVCCLQLPLVRFLPAMCKWATSAVLPPSAFRAHGLGWAGLLATGTGLVARCLSGGHLLTWPIPLVLVGGSTCNSALRNAFRESVSKEDKTEVEKMIIEQRRLREPAHALELWGLLSTPAWARWVHNIKALSKVQRKLAESRCARSRPRTCGNLVPRLVRFF